jgi:hypothetical protein
VRELPENPRMKRQDGDYRAMTARAHPAGTGAGLPGTSAGVGVLNANAAPIVDRGGGGDRPRVLGIR